MKKVISNNELREYMKKTVNLLCDTVSSTLGPTGNNTLINNSDTSPFITNDGVTIASNIESDNKIENTILEIVKEASLKTNELVGDGTTTTLVLLQSIFNLGLEEINKGINPITLKNELLEYTDIIVEKIKENKIDAKYEDLLNIALTSSNDKEIAKLSTNINKFLLFSIHSFITVLRLSKLLKYPLNTNIYTLFKLISLFLLKYILDKLLIEILYPFFIS